MSLQNTQSGERLHISFFGKRNAGKSSVVNAVTGQSLSVVSDVKGTTTDPVKKAMELLPLGPVVIIDTPGFDDVGELGMLRVEKTRQILAKTDIAVMISDAQNELDDRETQFINELKNKKLPYIIVHNKSDLLPDVPHSDKNNIWVSAKDNININELKNKIADIAKLRESNKKLISDLVEKQDIIVLVTPIDESAPKGRLILPQQHTIRDILDSKCTAVVCQPEQLDKTLKALVSPPKMVVTDSQAFGFVSKIVPHNIILTSFSILFARYKGELEVLVAGASMLSKLNDGDRILISEGCTHHRQCGDIGTVKLPKWISEFSSSNIEFDFTSGGEFPKDLSPYKLIVHCGGCMLNEAEMQNRINMAQTANVPIVNYGVAIAHMNGILKRSLEVFPDVAKLL